MKTRRRKTLAVENEPFIEIDLDEEFETVCRVCEAEFLDRVDLKQHIAQMHMNEANGKMICRFCCAVLASGEDFVTHFIFKHLENLTFCAYCYRAFSDTLELEEHVLKHCVVDDNTAVTCSQCNNIFSNKLELQNHDYNKHRNSEEGFMLNGFFSLLSSALNIKISRFIECVSKGIPLTCTKCGHVNQKICDYVKHLKHSNCRSIACDKCFNIYKKKGGIILHMRHHPECHNILAKDAQKQCAKCDKYFNIKDIAGHRDNCNALKCTSCNEIFESIHDLSNHRTKQHQVIVSLESCKFCKKQFVGMASLKKHIHRIHKDKSLYKYNCVYCGSMHMHPSKLFAHFYSRHKDINPFTCKICNKVFRIRKQFTIHIKVIHNSTGFVEFDKNLHAVFTDKKSENPVEPKPYGESTTDFSDSDSEDIQKKTTVVTRNKRKARDKQTENKGKDFALQGDDAKESNQHNLSQDINMNINDTNSLEDEDCLEQTDFIGVQIEQLKSSSENKAKRTRRTRKIESDMIVLNSQTESDDNDDDDEPLSNIKESLLNEKLHVSNKSKRDSKDKRKKLTCKICNKFCYTIQNYHHHSTLHEKTKLKKCIKCQTCFNSRIELKEHMATSHSSSKLTETLKSLLEKRKKANSDQRANTKPGEHLKSLLEQRKRSQQAMVQNLATNKFRNTIKKVDVTDDYVATITPMTDHGLSVKKFIETFRPEIDNVSISNSVTIKTINTPVDKEPQIKLKPFKQEGPIVTNTLRLPVKFQETPDDNMDATVSVKLVQQLITKPSIINMTLNEKIPAVDEIATSEEYCNMFADETDYTQYKNDQTIPEVAEEVMLQDTDDIPRSKRLEQEIIIPRIPKGHGNVRIGHLLPEAPFFKIVPVNKLLEPKKDLKGEEQVKEDIKLPDGTKLVSIKNPYAHLIPNEHLEEVLKANRNKYYKGKKRDIELALVKALTQAKLPTERKTRKKVNREP